MLPLGAADPGQLLGPWPGQRRRRRPSSPSCRLASVLSKPAASEPAAAPIASSSVAPNPSARTVLPLPLERDPRSPDDVALACVREGRRQCVRCVELHEAVALRADEADRCRGERAVERGEDRLRVVTVGGVRRGDRVGGDEDRMTGRVVDGRRIGAAIARAAAAVAVDRRIEADEQLQAARWRWAGAKTTPHQHGVPARVGDVVGLDAVLAVLVRRGDLAGHPAGVVHGLHRVRHVAGLEVGEGRAVRDDVLEGLDVGVVDGRVVDVAEDAAGDRVPDLRRRVPRRAQAVLAGQVEVRQGARTAGRAMIDGDRDRQDVRHRVVGEGDLRVVGRDGERDVRPVRDTAGAVVLVPALVDRDLGLVRAGRQRGRLERVDAVAVGVLQPGPEAARVPVAGAAQLGLEAARGHGDDRAAGCR